MSAVRYPVAPNAETALNAPLGRAVREREAGDLAGEPVTFVTEVTGPAFASLEEALDAWRGKVDDSRPGRTLALEPQDRFCSIREVMAEGAGRPPRPQRPVMRKGRRWPEPRPAPAVVWRLSVSYWRIVRPEELPVDQARQVRKDQRAAALSADRLRKLAAHPMRPFKPQQPLDVGLFETRLPEQPDRIIPDE